jgi:hypothetical protein
LSSRNRPAHHPGPSWGETSANVCGGDIRRDRLPESGCHGGHGRRRSLMMDEPGEEVNTGGRGGSGDHTAKTIAMCITVPNGELPGGRRGSGCQGQIDYRRSFIATAIKRERSQCGPHGKSRACGFEGSLKVTQNREGRAPDSAGCRRIGRDRIEPQQSAQDAWWPTAPEICHRQTSERLLGLRKRTSSDRGSPG